MKSFTKRILAASLAAAMMAALLSGCKNDEPGGVQGQIGEQGAGGGGGQTANAEGGGGAFETQGSAYQILADNDNVYIAETVKLPSDAGNIINAAYYGGKVYYTAVAAESANADNGYLASADIGIYTINIDGTDNARLEGYAPLAQKTAGAGLSARLGNMSIDSEGNIWLTEEWTLYEMALPEGFDSDSDNPWAYQNILEKGLYIRKLDSAGRELLSIDAVAAIGQQENIAVTALAFDENSGDIHFAAELLAGANSSAEVYGLLGSSGNMYYRAQAPYRIERFIKLGDNTMAALPGINYWQETEIREQTLLKFRDTGTPGGDRAFSLDEEITLPIPNAQNTGPAEVRYYSGGGGYDLLIDDGQSVYAHNLGTTEMSRLFNWMRSGVVANNIQSIVALSDTQVFCISYIWGETTQAELHLLTKIPLSELPEKTVLTLATFNYDRLDQSLQNAVMNFNRSNLYYRIEATNYAQYSTDDDYDAGIRQLNTEITAGNIPDILCVSQMSFLDYVDAGLLADLYEFIDADPVLSRDSFVPGVFDAFEIDGKLYQVFRDFLVMTVSGAVSKIGEGPSWDTGELLAVLDAHPEADMPMGSIINRGFLTLAIGANEDYFIDRVNGTVSFDTPAFVRILEIAGRLPRLEDIDNTGDRGLLASGRAIMTYQDVRGFSDIYSHKQRAGGDVVYKGVPVEDKSGSGSTIFGGSLAFSITEQSQNKDAAWLFIRNFLTREAQQDLSSGFASNREAFDAQVAQALEGMNVWHFDDSGMGTEITVALTQEEVDKALELISSARPRARISYDEQLRNLIFEDADDYFNGLIDAETAAKRIEQRAAIYISERS